MTGLKIFLFGHPRIMCRNSRIEIGHRKSIALLAYLVTTKQSHSRESLATMLWPDADQRRSLGNLRRAIYRVNKALNGDILVATRSLAEFNRSADVWTDTDAFQSHAHACLGNDQTAEKLNAYCISVLSEAVEMYTNDFLAGFTLPDSREFDEWQYFQSENYKQTLEKMLDWLLVAFRERKDWQQAIFYGRRRLALNPIDDSTYYKIIELYALNNQRAAALQQFDEYCKFLAEEIGVPPDERIVALVESLRNNEFPRFKDKSLGTRPLIGRDRHNGNKNTQHLTSLSRVNHLPDQSRPFIGRKKELADIQHRLVSDVNCRLITLTGLSGIGKTRLAIEAGTKAAHIFKDGIYFLPLASLKSGGNIASEIAEQVLGLTYEGIDTTQRLFSVLRDKRLLLILDNFEHLLPAPVFLSDLLDAAPGVKLLVTSTERLNLKAETVYMLEGMAYPKELTAEDAVSYDAMQLFIKYAHLARPQITISPADHPTIVRICHIVLGMPIAIILAAGWIDVLSYEEIAEEISKNIDFLKGELHDLPRRQLSLRAVFEYSWKRLAPVEKDVFMRLSVHRDGFNREAANQFAGADLQTLRSLIDKSIISMNNDGRYDIHALLCHFAEEQLRIAGRLEETRTSHSSYYLKFLGMQTARLKGRGQRAALKEIDADFENIRAAWKWALQTRDEAGINQALESMFLFCDIRGRQEEGANLFKDAESALAPKPGDRPSLVYGRILIRLGMLQSRYLRDCPALQETIQGGLRIVRGYDSEPDIAFGLLSLAHYAGDTQQDGNSALQLFQQSYDLFSALGDDYYAARAVHLIGHCQLFTSGIANFIPYGEQSLRISRRIGDKANVALLLISLAMVEFFIGNYQATGNYAREALSVASQVGHMPAWAQSNNFLGILALLEGELVKADKYIQEAFAIARNVNFPIPLIYAQASEAVLNALEDKENDNLQHVNLISPQQADPYARLFTHWAQAVVECSRGDYHSAQHHTVKINAIDSQLGAPSIAALTLPVSAIIQANENCPVRAVELLGLAESHPLSYQGWMEHWSVLRDTRANLRARLGAGEYRSAWERGGSRLDVICR